MRKVTYVEPKPKETSVSRANALPEKPNSEFIYGHRDEQWQLVEYKPMNKDGKRGKPEWKWLPRLSQIPIKRGVNGMTGDDDRYIDASSFTGRYRDTGGVLFKHGDKRLGPHADYLCVVPCEKGGTAGSFHLTKWERPVVLNGRVRQERDGDGFNDFLNYVMEQGLVEPMSEFVLQDAIDLQEKKISTMRNRPSETYGLGDRVKRQEEKLDRMKSAWQKQFGGLDAE